MNHLALDPNKNVAIFVNDFDQEFADALTKLGRTLHRPLRGIILVDKQVKRKRLNTPDKDGVFEQIVCDFADDAQLRSVIKDLQPNLLLVTCSAERNQPYLRQLLPHVPYTLGPTESSLIWATHKAKMRDLLRSYDSTLVPKAYSVYANWEDEIDSLLRTLTFPLIVKPTGLAASMLVSKVSTEQELRQKLTSGFSLIKDLYDRDLGRGEPSMIVEEFINGQMYSIDAYVNHQGEVWVLPFVKSTTAHSVGQEGFYIYQAHTHIKLSEEEVQAGYAATRSAIHALGLRSCVAHVELFLTADGWKIIELGPRAGGLRQDLYQTAYAIDHAYNELRIKVGLEPELPARHVAHSATFYIYPEKEGVIEAIEGIELARNHPSLYLLNQKANIGDTARFSQNGGTYVVRGLLTNPNLEALNQGLEEVRSLIKVTTR